MTSTTKTKTVPPGKDFIWTKREEECNRCDGVGSNPRTYATCKRCKGTGRMNRVVRLWRDGITYGEMDAIEEAEKAAKQAKKAMRGLDRVLAATPGLKEAFAKIGHDDAFINSLREYAAKHGKLSAKQIACVFKAEASLSSRSSQWGKDAAYPIPIGRCTFQGIIVSMKSTDYGPRMMIRTKYGWRCWGTVPSNIRGKAQVGWAISLRATLKHSSDDETFAFFSRPSNATCYAEDIWGSRETWMRLNAERARSAEAESAPAADYPPPPPIPVEIVLAETVEDAIEDIGRLPERFRIAVELGIMNYAEAATAAAQAKASKGW